MIGGGITFYPYETDRKWPLSEMVRLQLLKKQLQVLSVCRTGRADRPLLLAVSVRF